MQPSTRTLQSRALHLLLDEVLPVEIRAVVRDAIGESVVELLSGPRARAARASLIADEMTAAGGRDVRVASMIPRFSQSQQCQMVSVAVNIVHLSQTSE
jgi:hypothetical protein